jgi:hypothetical protein
LNNRHSPRQRVSLAGFVDQHADIASCCEGTNEFDSLVTFSAEGRRVIFTVKRPFYGLLMPQFARRLHNIRMHCRTL